MRGAWNLVPAIDRPSLRRAQTLPDASIHGLGRTANATPEQSESRFALTRSNGKERFLGSRPNRDAGCCGPPQPTLPLILPVSGFD